MIRRLQALNYRCLRYVDVRLDRFHVLVGPNASGKSTRKTDTDFISNPKEGSWHEARRAAERDVPGDSPNPGLPPLHLPRWPLKRSQDDTETDR